MVKQFIIYIFIIVIVYNLHISYVTASDLEMIDIPETYINDAQFSLSGIQNFGYSVHSGFGQGSRRQYNLLTTKDDSCSIIIKTSTYSRKIETEEEKIMSGLLIRPKDTKTLFGWKIEKDTSYFKEVFTRNNVIVESYGTGICYKKIRRLLKKIKMKYGEIYEPIPPHSLVKVKQDYDQKRYILNTGMDNISILDIENKLIGGFTEEFSFLLSARELEEYILEEGTPENIIEYNSLELNGLDLRYIVMRVNHGGKSIYITTYLLPDIYGRVAIIMSERNNARQNLMDIMGPIELRSDNIGIDSSFDEISSGTAGLQPPSLQEPLER